MFQASTRWIYAAEGFRAFLGEHELGSVAALSSPSLGEVVTNRRSSWVRRWETLTTAYYIKTYDYPTWSSRARGVFRNTVFAWSRPHREMRAMAWLLGHGFGAARVQAVVESRTLGALTRAVLVTEAWPGATLETLLPSLAKGPRAELLARLIEFVQRLHAAGFRDGNLDLRNLLARPVADGWEFAKIDSPRFRIVPPDRTDDPLAAADWRRLDDSLREVGLGLPHAVQPPH